MYPILISLDEGLVRILQMEMFDLNILLKIALVKQFEVEKHYTHMENKKNIRLFLHSNYFFILNSICRENHSYLNEYAGELITEMFLDIIKNE